MTHEATLFVRFGGRAMVERVVDDFYGRVEGDSHMRPIYPEDLSSGRRKLTLWMEEWLGGEPRYSALYGHPRLRLRHFPYVIDELAAGLWLRHMRSAMNACGVDAGLQLLIFKTWGQLAKHMVNANDDVPRELIGDVRLS